MKKSICSFLFSSFSLFILLSCGSGSGEKIKLAPNAHKVKAEEIIQTSRYTYVRVSNEEGDYWIAINKADITKGKTYFWSVGMEMNNFTSKELQRTFPSIFFIQDFTDVPITASSAPSTVPPSAPASSSGRQVIPKYHINPIEKSAGTITLAELFEGNDKFDDKKLKVRGQVVKVANGIMNKNWIHLQDGTEYKGQYDLTITTSDTVPTGHVVTLEGIISLNRDFGAGYSYDIIMENARLLKK